MKYLALGLALALTACSPKVEQAKIPSGTFTVSPPVPIPPEEMPAMKEAYTSLCLDMRNVSKIQHDGVKEAHVIDNNFRRNPLHDRTVLADLEGDIAEVEQSIKVSDLKVDNACLGRE